MKFILLFLAIGYYLIFLMECAPIPDRQLYDKLKKVKHVEDGGCGFVAYYVYEYLQARNQKCEIVEFATRDNPRIHFMVHYKKVWIDVEGMYGITPLQLLPHSVVDPQDLRKELNDASLWNKKFKRSDTTRIKNILQ